MADRLLRMYYLDSPTKLYKVRLDFDACEDQLITLIDHQVAPLVLYHGNGLLYKAPDIRCHDWRYGW